MSNVKKRLEAAFGLKEDTAPKLGIWYYLWLKPKWKLWTMPLGAEDRPWTHPEAWEVLAEDLGKHYQLDQERVELVKGLHYALPRGRVDTKELETGKQLGRITLYHGDDFPSGLSREGELKRIIAQFDLTKLALHDQIDALFARHKTMDANQQRMLQEVIGPIPY